MALILGILLLFVALVTEIAKDWLGYQTPIFLKYGCLFGSFVTLTYDHWSKKPYEVRIRETDWTKTNDEHRFTILSQTHRKGSAATCVVFRESGKAREPVGTGLEYSGTGDIVISVNTAPELIAVVS